MNVLSLFDGMSCGRIALDKLGIKPDNYFAYEIDKYAIKVAKANYPDIQHLGDVQDWAMHDLPKIDLLLGGSPCQGFSFAGKQLNFKDPRSKLFFTYVDILKAYKPKYFLLENVKMKKEYQDIISQHLGVEPIEINSNLVSAQNRRRLYWFAQIREGFDFSFELDCNKKYEKYKKIRGIFDVFRYEVIPVNITQPEDKGILLKDIVHENCEAFSDKSQHVLAIDLSEYIVPFDKTLQILDKEVERGKVGYFRKDSQANRVYYIHDKAVTLCGDAGGGAAKMGQYLFGSTKRNSQGDRVYSEEEKSPTLNASSGGTAGKGNLLFGCLTPDRVNKRQNGQRFSDGKKFYTLTAQDKHGILVEGYIRKLTPVECERLQTVPDGYTDHVSNSQRYKMLGNGWTVDVIAHILKEMDL